MKKYIFVFAVSCFFICLNAGAQTPAVATTTQSSVVKDTLASSRSDSPTQIAPAKKNEQSVVIPPSSGTGNNAATGSQSNAPVATPAQGQSSTIDPKKRN